MIIRRIEPEDAGNVSALIVRTLREVNTKRCRKCISFDC